MSDHPRQYRNAPATRRAMRALDPRAADATALLPQAVLGVFVVALVAVASLPQARLFDDGFGWIPLWLLALPASAWCALWAARRRTSAADPCVAALPSRRRGLARVRRRLASGVRPRRPARAA